MATHSTLGGGGGGGGGGGWCAGEYKCIPSLLLSMRKRLIECINKGGGHILAVKQDITYNIYEFVIIICSCLCLFSTKAVNWGSLLFISMSICFGCSKEPSY